MKSRVQARVDAAIKEEASVVLAAMGLTGLLPVSNTHC